MFLKNVKTWEDLLTLMEWCDLHKKEFTCETQFVHDSKFGLKDMTYSGKKMKNDRQRLGLILL